MLVIADPWLSLPVRFLHWFLIWRTYLQMRLRVTKTNDYCSWTYAVFYLFEYLLYEIVPECINIYSNCILLMNVLFLSLYVLLSFFQLVLVWSVRIAMLCSVLSGVTGFYFFSSLALMFLRVEFRKYYNLVIVILRCAYFLPLYGLPL